MMQDKQDIKNKFECLQELPEVIKEAHEMKAPKYLYWFYMRDEDGDYYCSNKSDPNIDQDVKYIRYDLVKEIMVWFSDDPKFAKECLDDPEYMKNIDEQRGESK